MPPQPRLFGLGTVVGFEDHALSLARIQLTESQNGGKIDPNYIDNQRVLVHRMNGMDIVLILPKGMTVNIGDRVTMQSSYRSAALPCNYVPNQIATDLGPPPPPSQTGRPLPEPPPSADSQTPASPADSQILLQQ